MYKICFQKVGWVEETKGEGKGEMTVNNIKIHHIFVGTRHNKMH
jgi:hypothetical protein